MANSWPNTSNAGATADALSVIHPEDIPLVGGTASDHWGPKAESNRIKNYVNNKMP